MPTDPVSGFFAGEDTFSKTKQSLESIGAILATASAEIRNVVKTMVYQKNMKDFGAINEIDSQYFSGDYSACVAVEVGCLPKDARVAIKTIAVL